MTEKRHSGVPGGGGGVDVKSGSVSLSSASFTAVSFATAFAGVPAIACVAEGTAFPEEYFFQIFIRNVTVSGFDLGQSNKDGNTHIIHWIATAAGNP